MSERFEPFDWYADGRYYDAIFDLDTGRDADFLEAVLERYGTGAATGGSVRRVRRVLEPGCGSGRLLAALAARGWRVRGFDASPGMLRFARARLRERGLRAVLARGRMERFTVPAPFDLAHCLVSTFKYLPDDAAARGHLGCVARALRPGGVYALGVHLTDYADRGRTRERWVAQRDGLHVTCNIQSWPADRRRRTERVRCRLVVREDGAERRLETTWTFRTYGPGQLRALLRSVPALEHVATFGFEGDVERPIPFDGERLDTILVLRRR